MRKNINTAWDILYTQDMEQMGWLFEYAGNTLRLDMDEFTEKFMNSMVRKAMDFWHAQYSNEPTECLYDRLATYGVYIEKRDEETIWYPDELRWVGEAYAYIHYYTSEMSADIYKVLKFRDMLRLYKAGHERSWVSFAENLIKELP